MFVNIFAFLVLRRFARMRALCDFALRQIEKSRWLELGSCWPATQKAEDATRRTHGNDGRFMLRVLSKLNNKAFCQYAISPFRHFPARGINNHKIPCKRQTGSGAADYLLFYLYACFLVLS